MPDRVVKEDGLLGHQGDLPAQVIDGDLPNICRADAHRAPLWIIEPQEQVGERGLAGPAAADQRHQPPGLDGEVDPAQDRLLAVIKVDVIEVDVRLAGLERHRLGRIGDRADGIQQLEHPLVGRTGLLQLILQARQVLNGRVHQEDAANEGDKDPGLADALDWSLNSTTYTNTSATPSPPRNSVTWLGISFARITRSMWPMYFRVVVPELGQHRCLRGYRL